MATRVGGDKEGNGEDGKSNGNNNKEGNGESGKSNGNGVKEGIYSGNKEDKGKVARAKATVTRVLGEGGQQQQRGQWQQRQGRWASRMLELLVTN
jgi:hypothetical protein